MGQPGQRGRRAALEGALLLLILALAAWLRLSGAAANPGWFSDEGTHLSIAHNLLLGRDQYLAVGGSVLLASRLPAFEWLLAGALRLAGAGPGGDPARGMAALRALTGTLGVLSVVLVYFVAREREKEREKEKVTSTFPRLHTPTLALVAALIHALYPAAIIYSRLGFSYNLLAPVGLGAFWAAGRYVRGDGRRWLALAAALAGLCTLVDLWAWVWLPALAGAVVMRGWNQIPHRAEDARLGMTARAGGATAGGRVLRHYGLDAALALAVAVAPFGLYALRQLLVVPEAFLFDLRFVLGRLGALSLGQQAAALAENVSVLAAQEGWLMLGLLGLFALRPARRAGLALLFTLLPILLLGRTTALYSLGFYYLIPLLPWAGVGIAALAEREREKERGARALRLALGVAVVVVLGGTLWSDVRGVREGFATAIDPFLLDAGDARAAADYLAEHRAPDELVLASPALAWLLPGEAADFQMALAYAGQATPHIPPSLPPERYAYSPHPDRARYVVVDNLTRNWSVVHMLGLGALLNEVEQWPVVFQAGEIAVYARP